MKLVLPDVPKTISRKSIVQFVESLGLDPHEVKAMGLTWNTLCVTVAAHNEDGSVIDAGRNEIVKHQFIIEIVD